METTLEARSAEVHPNFREYAGEGITKMEQLTSRTQHVDVELTHKRNPRQADAAERTEITVHGKGPVVCTEASPSNRYAAVDIAVGKLCERLRRVRDRIRNHRRYDVPPGVDSDVVMSEPQTKPTPVRVPLEPGGIREDQLGDSPVIVREKLHETTPVSVEEVLDEIELVGYPFYLLIGSEIM